MINSRNIRIISFGLLVSLCSFKVQHKKTLHIVFIGDSITEARGIKDPSKKPSNTVESYLKSQRGYSDVEVNNQGKSGFTTVDFLPAKKGVFQSVLQAAGSFKKDSSAILVFSVMLGTNDSAIKGPNGAPVSKENYRANLKTLCDSLFAHYPACKIVLHAPLWYSDSTRNSSTYFVEGRQRLQSYIPQIAALVSEYHKTYPGHIFIGDREAYGFFRKNHLTDMIQQTGPSGIFYLHPNDKGSSALGVFWARAIHKALR